MTEYDVRDVLESYGGNASAAISGLMRFGNMSRKDAEESVVASGGELTERYLENMRIRESSNKRKDV